MKKLIGLVLELVIISVCGVAQEKEKHNGGGHEVYRAHIPAHGPAPAHAITCALAPTFTFCLSVEGNIRLETASA